MNSLVREETENGRAVKIEKKRIWVELNGCDAEAHDCQGGCVSCSSSSRKSRRVAIDLYSGAPEVTVDSWLRIRHYTLNENLVAFIVFGMPVLFAVMVIGLWPLFFDSSIESPQAIVTTLAAFIAGFLVSAVTDVLMRHRFPSRILDYSTTGSERAHIQE